MTEQSNDLSTHTKPDSSTTDSPAASFHVLEQFIKDLSFENPQAPMIFEHRSKEMSVNFQISLKSRAVGENLHEVVNTVVLHSYLQDVTVFVFEIDYSFVIHTEKQGDELSRIVFSEIPRLAFPFIRQIIHSTVQDAGFPSVYIKSQDFENLYKMALEQHQQNNQNG